MSEVAIAADAESAAEIVADIVLAQIEARPATVLGIATGSSPERAYGAIGKRARLRDVDLNRVTGFALDEYIGLPPRHPALYVNVIRHEIEPALGLRPGAVAVPDVTVAGPSACARYEQAIAHAGGIDVQLLGIGRTGHIGFNEPGSSLSSRTRVKALTDTTRQDNSRFFEGGSCVPTHSITQGIGTILDAKHLVLIATGAHKAEAVALAVEGPLSAGHPASAIQLHPHVTVVLDAAAASMLQHRDYYESAWLNRELHLTEPASHRPRLEPHLA